ncbi:MAG: hypothetical protein GY869_31310 [Planctomycetes bacterium]|nr:hypothetical protein [Planctomycetota bacterium]
MSKMPECPNHSLKEFVDLVSGLKGVVEVKVLSQDGNAWIGLRPSNDRPAPALLQQVSRAAIGFGLDAHTVHFGILAD